MTKLQKEKMIEIYWCVRKCKPWGGRSFPRISQGFLFLVAAVDCNRIIFFRWDWETHQGGPIKTHCIAQKLVSVAIISRIFSVLRCQHQSWVQRSPSPSSPSSFLSQAIAGNDGFTLMGCIPRCRKILTRNTQFHIFSGEENAREN